MAPISPSRLEFIIPSNRNTSPVRLSRCSNVHQYGKANTFRFGKSRYLKLFVCCMIISCNLEIDIVYFISVRLISIALNSGAGRISNEITSPKIRVKHWK